MMLRTYKYFYFTDGCFDTVCCSFRAWNELDIQMSSDQISSERRLVWYPLPRINLSPFRKEIFSIGFFLKESWDQYPEAFFCFFRYRFYFHCFFHFAEKRYRKTRFFVIMTNFKRDFRIQIVQLDRVWGCHMEFDFDEISFKKIRSKKPLLFLELEMICEKFQELSFWSFCERHFIMGFRQYGKLWRAVKPVSEEIFKNPLAWWKYMAYTFVLANKSFSADWSKTL